MTEQAMREVFEDRMQLDVMQAGKHAEGWYLDRTVSAAWAGWTEALQWAAEGQEPVAWMRKWAFDKETPKKEKNPETGRMCWPRKFKLLPLTLMRGLIRLTRQSTTRGRHERYRVRSTTTEVTGMSEANVHVDRPVGRYGKTKEFPAKYGRVVDVSGCGRYWKFEYGQTRRIAKWFAADEIELHPLPANDGGERR